MCSCYGLLNALSGAKYVLKGFFGRFEWQSARQCSFELDLSLVFEDWALYVTFSVARTGSSSLWSNRAQQSHFYPSVAHMTKFVNLLRFGGRIRSVQNFWSWDWFFHGAVVDLSRPHSPCQSVYIALVGSSRFSAQHALIGTQVVQSSRVTFVLKDSFCAG